MRQLRDLESSRRSHRGCGSAVRPPMTQRRRHRPTPQRDLQVFRSKPAQFGTSSRAGPVTGVLGTPSLGHHLARRGEDNGCHLCLRRPPDARSFQPTSDDAGGSVISFVVRSRRPLLLGARLRGSLFLSADRWRCRPSLSEWDPRGRDKPTSGKTRISHGANWSD